ncbi:MAG TPA: SH3 domain-containing protein, partial [Blastocatellia bacterium]|nr:SH3 domain-containing protein [Blastocatellia bacterium]
ATVVRSRLRAASTVEQVATLPNFQTLANVPREINHPQKARIVVELPGHVVGRGDEQDEERASPATQVLGSARAANGSRVQTLDRDGSVIIASDAKPATSSAGQTTVHILRPQQGLLDRMRTVVSSEWLRRVFIIFLAAALIGLVASTYYHYAGRRPGLPFFGLSAKDGRIANAPKVNLRSDPSGSVLVELPEGTRVRVVEERGGWFRIRILDWAGTAPDDAPDIGWVGVRYVKLD